jgi:hypothetical protein
MGTDERQVNAADVSEPFHTVNLNKQQPFNKRPRLGAAILARHFLGMGIFGVCYWQVESTFPGGLPFWCYGYGLHMV